MANNNVSLSTLFRNPVVADAFRRAERGSGSAFAVPAPKLPLLNGGHAVRTQVEYLVEELIATLDAMDGDCDLEPFLASFFDGRSIENDDREDDDERENDPAEFGIADEGGLAEQAPYYDTNLNLALFAV